MKPGDIYRMNFNHQPPAQGSDYRPALILQVDGVRKLAIAVKITRSEPTKDYPHRKRIEHKDHASLDYESYAQYDWYNIVTTTGRMKYMGTLHPTDFILVLDAFNEFHNK